MRSQLSSFRKIGGTFELIRSLTYGMNEWKGLKKWKGRGAHPYFW